MAGFSNCVFLGEAEESEEYNFEIHVDGNKIVIG